MYSFTCPVTLEEVPVWEHDSNVITKYNGEDSEVTVPSELDGDTITAIGEGAFSNNNVIKRVNIPASITSIEDGAFYECENLSVVHFAEGSELTTIGQGAFCYCPELAEVNFEDLKNLKTIGSSEVTLADGVAIETVMSAADNEGEVKLYAYWLDAPEIKGTSISLNGDVTTNIYVMTISEFDIEDVILTSERNGESVFYMGSETTGGENWTPWLY